MRILNFEETSLISAGFGPSTAAVGAASGAAAGSASGASASVAAGGTATCGAVAGGAAGAAAGAVAGAAAPTSAAAAAAGTVAGNAVGPAAAVAACAPAPAAPAVDSTPSCINGLSMDAESTTCSATAPAAAVATATVAAPSTDSGGDGGGGGGSVICTELCRTGELDHATWSSSLRYTNTVFSEQIMNGYHLWGVPYVRLMRKSPLFAKLAKAPTTWFAEDNAYRMGERDAPNYKGMLIREVLFRPICWSVGIFAKARDWQGLWSSVSLRGLAGARLA